MKRKSSLTIVLVMIMIMAISLVGCSNKQSGRAKKNFHGVLFEETEGLESTNKADAKTNESQDIEVDKNISTVDITLPAGIVGDLTDFNEEKYLSVNEGIKAAKVNEDGSLTLTMTKSDHKELFENMCQSIDEFFGELIDGENTPYIKSIDYTREYRKVSVGVVREEYGDSFDLTPSLIGFSTIMYQSLAGIDFHTTIVINDVATGEEIGSVTYPDAWMEE